ncbi:hypothetical protein [Brevundimonas sp.]|uniref:DUF6874 family protein n=1 Tax=Brevundimonas sp. TaxID=1871086 RepID=UPI00286BF97E|nr:hypothetical protein [Brevundimonas sp.]
MPVSFDVSDEDAGLISTIVDRAEELCLAQGETLDRLSTTMDLTACHANGCPLDLTKLAKADNFNLTHDVFGIARHLDRTTGRLRDFFDPRCSLPEAQRDAA